MRLTGLPRLTLVKSLMNGWVECFTVRPHRCALPRIKISTVSLRRFTENICGELMENEAALNRPN